MQVERETYMGNYTLCITETGERNPFDENMVILHEIRVHGDVRKPIDIIIPCNITDISSNVVNEETKNLIKSINFDCHQTHIKPHGIRNISDNAFSGCYNLKKVNFPKTLCFIGKEAFCGTGLRKISIKRHNVHIDKRAFANIPELEKANISGVKNIPTGCFKGCENLSEVKFSKGLKKIGNKAFYKTNLCDNLDLTKYKKLRTVGNNAFAETYIEKVIVNSIYPENVGENAYGDAEIVIKDGDRYISSSDLEPDSSFEDFENEDPQWDDCR